MPLGEKERQDREVFQRNMKSRMETFKSGRHKRHKKERSLKKVLIDQSHTSSVSSSITNNTNTAADDSEDQQDNITVDQETTHTRRVWDVAVLCFLFVRKWTDVCFVSAAPRIRRQGGRRRQTQTERQLARQKYVT